MELPIPNMAGLQSQQHNVNYAESVESSPKSTTHQAEWDEPLPPVPCAKLRLMCSYGGHIIPRPHDRNLCYVGGETRIIVAERSTSLSDLTSRLSHSLLDGRKFTLKYQLPNEDLDSLISVSTDEDLDNMIEEYDRLAANASISKPAASSRLRLFLFFAKPETAQTMGALLDDAQSEAWFVEALNGAEVLSRGLSDSAAVGDLLRLDSGDHGMQLPPGCTQNAVQPKVAPQDLRSVQSIMSDSPMVENSSSFDSSTSSPSMAYLPPIRVRVDEMNDGNINIRLREDMKGGGALEEQFSTHLRVTQLPPIAISAPSYAAVVNAPTNNNDSNNNCVIPDDETGLSDHGGVPGASRKPPLPLPLPLQQRISGGCNMPLPNDSKHAAGFNLPSPDSAKSSSSSVASGVSLTKTTPNHDHHVHAQVNTSNENNPQVTQHTTEQRLENRTPSPQNQNVQQQPSQDPNKYMYPPHQQEQLQHQHQHQHQHQQQFIQDNVHYIPTHSQIPPSYRPVYAAQQPMHPQVDHQQYPVYYLPVTQTQQPYNVAQPGAIASLVPSSAHTQQPPVYTTRAAVAQTNNQFQQYIGYSGGVQPMAGNPANYNQYDYGHNQVYYTGQLATAAVAAPLATSQYQSMTPAQAAMIAEASMQLPKNECPKQPPPS